MINNENSLFQRKIILFAAHKIKFINSLMRGQSLYELRQTNYAEISQLERNGGGKLFCLMLDSCALLEIKSTY